MTKYFDAPSVVSTLKLQVPQRVPVSIFNGEDALTEYDRLNAKFGAGLTTGYEELDTFFKFLPQQLYLLSAATHVGKTTFALNLCARVASLGEKVLFCSLEQGVFIAPRVKTMLGNYPDKLSIMTSDDMVNIKQLTETFYSMTEKPKLICVDHLHFIKKEGRGTTQDIDVMIAELQNMAKKLEVPVLVIAHVRKLNDERPPTMDDLRDSSSLSQVPSVVVFLHRSKNEGDEARSSLLSNRGVIMVAKNRIQGKTGIIPFSLMPSGELILDFHD